MDHGAYGKIAKQDERFGHPEDSVKISAVQSWFVSATTTTVKRQTCIAEYIQKSQT